jgi:hypothetical protein
MDTSRITRVSVRITRKPITIITNAGYSYGGWMHFPIQGDKPHYRLHNGERVLWCPYCAEWTIFKKRADDLDTWKCTGWCGWGNTNDYYVKKMNDLFGDRSSFGKKKIKRLVTK